MSTEFQMLDRLQFEVSQIKERVTALEAVAPPLPDEYKQRLDTLVMEMGLFRAQAMQLLLNMAEAHKPSAHNLCEQPSEANLATESSAHNLCAEPTPSADGQPSCSNFEQKVASEANVRGTSSDIPELNIMSGMTAGPARRS